jgi:hypothetical protein
MQRFQRILVLLAVLCVSRAAYAKRGPAPHVPPLTFNGVRYSVSGGHIENEPISRVVLKAVDINSGYQVWEATLYEIKLNAPLETDVQDVYVTSMQVVDDDLEVSNEAGDTIKVDLATGKVIEGGGRTYYSDPEAEGRQQIASAWLYSVVALGVLCLLLFWYYRARPGRRAP